MGQVIPFPNRREERPLSPMASLAASLRTLAIYDPTMSADERARVVRICDNAIARG
jgi:hypothetical protein